MSELLIAISAYPTLVYTVLLGGGWGLINGALLVVPATMLTCAVLASPFFLISMIADNID